MKCLQESKKVVSPCKRLWSRTDLLVKVHLVAFLLICRYENVNNLKSKEVGFKLL